MSESKHWETSRDAVPDGVTQITVYGTDGKRIATVFDEEEARLIAAAPELLEIAKAYRNLLRTAAHTDGEVATFQHIEQVIALGE
jgi:hypothetical protein